MYILVYLEGLYNGGKYTIKYITVYISTSGSKTDFQ